jgi:hypothetical protein
LVLS